MKKMKQNLPLLNYVNSNIRIIIKTKKPTQFNKQVFDFNNIIWILPQLY
jgi:hypothetical protein